MANQMGSMNDSKSMYFDFGLGVGKASNWDQGSLAINAMTMGVNLNQNLAVEAGMDALPNGANSGGQAMTMVYHLAAKGIMPLQHNFSVFGKAGLGVNAYEGEAPSSSNMNMVNQASVGLYYAVGAQYHFNKTFSLYLEGSGIAVPNIGSNDKTQNGQFGSTYMGTVGLEVTI
jgi:hypothetical protein